MLPRLITLAAGLVLSLSANAGYVQYTFNNAVFNDGAALEGFFIQSDVDKSIAYYNVRSVGGAGPWVTFAPSTFDSNLESAHTHFAGKGPTSFTAYDALSGKYTMYLNLEFSPIKSAGEYRIAGTHESIPTMVEFSYYIHSLISGTVTASDITDPLLAANIETGVRFDGIKFIVPEFIAPGRVPEPKSLGLMLLAVGALALSRSKVRLK